MNTEQPVRATDHAEDKNARPWRRLWLRLARRRMCDGCGRRNPKWFEDNPRLCGECAVPGGLYKTGHDHRAIGANGKIGLYRLRWPIRFYWQGWWTLDNEGLLEQNNRLLEQHNRRRR